MKGIVNSEIDAVELLGLKTDDLYNEDCFRIRSALREYDVLIALVQKAAFDNIQYSPNDERFDNITPNQFRTAVSAALHELDSNIWEALRAFETKCENAGFKAYPDPHGEMSASAHLR